MSRREVFLGAAALPVVAALPAQASDDTPIMALFREWQRLDDEIERPERIEDDDIAALNDRKMEIETKMCAQPSLTGHDLAAKIIAVTDGDDFEISGPNADALWAEINGLVSGIRPLGA